MFGYIVPGAEKFSVTGTVLGAFRKAHRFAFDTSTNGSPSAMVPIGSYERVMPFDMLPTFLLRALIVRDDPARGRTRRTGTGRGRRGALHLRLSRQNRIRAAAAGCAGPHRERTLMRWLRERLDRIAPTFEKGGKLHRWHPLWEAMDTFFYSPPSVTTTGSHVRDAIDLKRMMMTVVIATLPCVFMAMFNTGLQANLAIDPGKIATARRLASRRDRRLRRRLFAGESICEPRARRAVLPAAVHRHHGRRPRHGKCCSRSSARSRSTRASSSPAFCSR